MGGGGGGMIPLHCIGGGGGAHSLVEIKGNWVWFTSNQKTA